MPLSQKNSVSHQKLMLQPIKDIDRPNRMLKRPKRITLKQCTAERFPALHYHRKQFTANDLAQPIHRNNSPQLQSTVEKKKNGELVVCCWVDRGCMKHGEK
jgi:hypothetical protein